MQLTESIKIGAREITMHKLRSILTMLGVIFGVAAVISTAAIGSGARDELNRQLSALGTNTIRIRAVELKGKELSDQKRLAPFGITRSDLNTLKYLLGNDLVAAAPLKKMESQVQSTGRVLPFDIYGTNEDLPMISGYTVAEGRFLNPIDVDTSAKVCVIGDEVRRSTFPLVNPIGQTLLIDGESFTVIGILAARGKSSGGTVIEVGDLDRSIYLPLNSAIRRLGVDDPRADKLDEIILKTRAESTLREGAEVADRALSRLHREVPDYKVVVPEELIRQQQQTKNVLSQVLVFIAAISLFVGGIGIMNIMLATVTQRTKEIGIRRALGATKRDILFQFLVESLVISLAGGLLGIGVGFALAYGIGMYAKWPTIVPIQSVIASTTIAAAVGFIFGLYPSLKAASLDPIEALRTE
ncbi:MAG TPA: ABC transporter permease [Candidatus Sumerlaeota bacterium]|nr:ABC transporter permease [Candidatus Sumerlaeota bacterium]